MLGVALPFVAGYSVYYLFQLIILCINTSIGDNDKKV